MARVDSLSHIPTSAFIDSLKRFQKHPEQFSLDLRAKFCGCNGSKDSRRSSSYQDVDIIRIIDFLITNPEKIPIKAVNRLCKITASPSLPQVKDKRTSHDHHKNRLSTKSANPENYSSSIRKHLNIPKAVTPTKSISHKRSPSSSTASHKSASYTCHSKSKHYSITSVSTRRSHLKKYRSRRNRTRSRSSFRSKKKNIRRSKEPLSSKTNEEQILSKRVPALTKHQPIPFVIIRLCCPPGMIPLTGKVAERLGLNIKMAESTKWYFLFYSQSLKNSYAMSVSSFVKDQHKRMLETKKKVL